MDKVIKVKKELTPEQIAERAITKRCKKRYNLMLDYVVTTQLEVSVPFEHYGSTYQIKWVNSKSKAFRWSDTQQQWISSHNEPEFYRESLKNHFTYVFKFTEKEWD